MGRFGSPYGIKGWIKVISFTDPIDKILDYLPWYINKNNNEVRIDAVKGKVHGGNLVVQLEGCQDRDLAKTYTNIEIAIDRAQLPDLTGEEYYWVDLVGLTVINQEKENLGKIALLFSTGSNDVIVAKDENGKERYIPYTENVIVKVDLQKQELIVDWDSTF